VRSTHDARTHVLDAAADLFLRAYEASGPPGALANGPLYRALMYLGRARRDVYNSKPDLAELMLDQARRQGFR